MLLKLLTYKQYFYEKPIAQFLAGADPVPGSAPVLAHVGRTYRGWRDKL
jgi:hypothetical protein